VQPINYPTVPVGQERLRVTPTPGHTKQFREHLVEALDSVWNELNLKRTSDWAAAGGFLGVGDKEAESVKPLWSDGQLGVQEAVKKITPVEGHGVIETLLEQEEAARATASASA
jgi:5-aminolevulinate synthase